MKREIIVTEDGSTTIHIPEWNEQYHSKHGAIQEAKHVFLKSGLHLFHNREIQLLEVGFGTGLNCLLTLLELESFELEVNYVGVEAYPVVKEELDKLNYTDTLNHDQAAVLFNTLHQSEWEKSITVTDRLKLTKRKQLFSDIKDKNTFDLVYFDAFGARVQPELWTVAIFKIMYEAMKKNGVLVTYSAKGSVRRAMQEVGFVVERLPGPPGKREMLRCTKK